METKLPTISGSRCLSEFLFTMTSKKKKLLNSDLYFVYATFFVQKLRS